MWRDCAQTCQNYAGYDDGAGDDGLGFDDEDSECFDESDK